MISQKTHSTGKMIAGILIAVLLFFGIILLSLNIREIKVTGNSRYTQEQIIGMLFESPWENNTVFCYLKDRMEKHKQIPFIEEYKIEMQGLHKVEVIVYEKSVVGYVSYMGSYMYFDKDGIVVESTSGQLEETPWITGLKFGHIVLHQPLPVENRKIFEEILNLTQVLSVYQIKVDKIHYDSRGQAVLYIQDIQVVLGDSSNINGKIAELSDQMPVLAGLAGTLYLDTYDETRDDMWFSFIKKS